MNETPETPIEPQATTPAGEPETPQPAARNTAQEIKVFLKELLETIGLALVLFVIINLLSARVRVEGYSMNPTLDNNQYVLVSRLTPGIGDLERRDIIVFRPPMYPEENWFQRLFGFSSFSDGYEDYIKRVIGLPGDTIRVEAGEVWVNGVVQDEPYIAEAPDYDGEWSVPEGNLFVLGDNRNNSSDSHNWSFLPINSVLGKAVLVYWPFSDWMVIRNDRAALAAP